MNQPRFNADQVIPASIASRYFGEIRKKAKTTPQFISDNNKIDSVVIDFKAYEDLFTELEVFRELAWGMNLAKRIEKADANPKKRYSLQEVIGENEHKELLSFDPNSISDKDLFE